MRLGIELLVASVFPVVFQWSSSVFQLCKLTLDCMGVIRFGHFPACNPLCIQLAWRELFELTWFHLYCNLKYTKTLMVLTSKACTEWCISTGTFERHSWYAFESSKLQVKAEFTKTCPLAASCPVILSFQTGMDVTLLNYTFLSVCGLV